MNAARVATGRFVAVVAATELLQGLAVYLLPAGFRATAYTPLQPFLLYFSASLMTGGTVLLLLARYRVAGPVRHILILLAVLPLAVLEYVFTRAGVWSGTVLYGLFAAALLAVPWLSPTGSGPAGSALTGSAPTGSAPPAGPAASRRPAPDLASLTFAAAEIAVGLLMLLFPGIFRSPHFDPIRPLLPASGAIGTVGGLFLLWTVRDGGRARYLDPGGRLLAAGLPLLLAWSFLHTRHWTGVVAWGVVGAAILIGTVARAAPAPEAAPVEGAGEDGADSLVAIERTVEIWTWLLGLIVVALTAVTGVEDFRSPWLVQVVVVAISAHNAAMHWGVPRLGSVPGRIAWRLTFLSLAVGVLTAGTGDSQHGILALLVAVPPLAMRALGSAAGNAMLGLVLAVVVAGHAGAALLEGGPWTRYLGATAVEVLVVAAAAAVGMQSAGEQRRLILGLDQARAELQEAYQNLQAANEELMAQQEELAVQQQAIQAQNEELLQQSAALRRQRDEVQAALQVAREEKEARERLAAILEATTDFVATATAGGRVLYCNHAARRLLGIGEHEDVSSLTLAGTHADWAQAILLGQAIPTALRDGVWTGETALLSREGREIPVSAVILAHRSPDGAVAYLSVVARDISGRMRREEALSRSLALERALRSIDQALLEDRGTQDILQAVCDGVLGLGFRMCWVGLVESSGYVRPVAAAGAERGYLDTIRVRWDNTSEGQGPTGRAIRTGRAVVVMDIGADPDFEPWRIRATRSGYRSFAAIPLTGRGQTLGALNVYSERRDAFGAEALQDLEQLATRATLALLTAERRDALARAQQLQSFHIEHMPLGHIIWDPDLRVVQWNRAAETIFGWTAADAIGRSMADLMALPGQKGLLDAGERQALLAGKPWAHSVQINARRDGTRITCEWFDIVLRDAAGTVVGFASMVQEVSQVDRLRAEVVEAERRFHDLAEAAAEGILMVDAAGRITYGNPAAEAIAGYPRGGLEGQPLSVVLPDVGLEPGRWEGECVRAGGERIPVEGSTSRIEGASGTYYTLVLRDLTERKQYEARILYLADHDPLTDLFNRRRFQEELEQALLEAREEGTEGALLFVDLDGFKDVNDSFGHRAGDELLQVVAALLREHVPPSGILGRLGGDEFAIVLPRTGPDEARAVAEGVLQAVREHVFVTGGRRVSVTASVGIGLFPEHGHTVEDLLAQADLAMYEAKDNGGNAYQVYGGAADEQEQARTRFDWKNQILEALNSEDRFCLYLQPILDLRTGHVNQYEVLLRMRRPDGSIVPAGQFIATAERHGLIHAVDRWVVRESIRLLCRLQRQGRRVYLEVNLSGKAFRDGDLLSLIRQELEASSVDPAFLVFEITETAAISDLSRAQKFIEALKGMGLRFALDDFGVGFASFSHLKHLSVDYLKIDGSFIRNLPRDPVDRHLVRAFVEVARGLGLRTVAEFVEDEDTLRILQEFGVDYAQGYHIGHPQPAPEG